MNMFFAESSQSLPVLRRVRGFHLYTSDSQRYLDLFLCRAAALLGHGCPHYSLVIKNTASQGMYMPYPNLWDTRLRRTIASFFPGYRVYISSPDHWPQAEWLEPWQVPLEGCTYAFWRPSLPPPRAQYLALVLPLSYQPYLFVLTKADFPSLPVELPIPAMLARLCLRALHYWPQANALPAMPANWEKYFGQHGEVHGRYFFSTLSADTHKRLYENALEHYIILPPKPFLAGALPTQMSQGEEKLLQEVLK